MDDEQWSCQRRFSLNKGAKEGALELKENADSHR